MNTIYDIGRYLFATAQFNWTTQKTVVIAFSGEAEFFAGDRHTTDIISRGTAVAAAHSLDILGKAVSTDGYLQTGPVVLPSVPIGPVVTHFVLATFATVWSDGAPILFLDDVMNLPFEPNGLDIVVQPDWLQQRGWGRV